MKKYLVRGEEPTEILVIADPPAARRRSLSVPVENIMNEMQKEHSKFVCFLFFFRYERLDCFGNCSDYSLVNFALLAFSIEYL